MTIRTLLTTSTLLLPFLVAACDADPVEPGETVRVEAGDELHASDLVADDAILIESGAAEAPRWTAGGELTAPTNPQGDYCEFSWTEWDVIDNQCGSCAYQPNMPGWKRAIRYRLCNSCDCGSWKIDAIYCNPC